MIRGLIIITIATIILTSNLSALAEPGNRGMELGKDILPIISKLDLTEYQSEKIKKLRKVLMREIDPLEDLLEERREELMLLWEQVNPDQDEILAKVKEIRKIHERLSDKLIHHRFDFMDILTNEQKAKLSEFR